MTKESRIEDIKLEERLSEQVYTEIEKTRKEQDFLKSIGDFLFYSGKGFINVAGMIYRIPTVSRQARDYTNIELGCVCDSSEPISENIERVKEKEKMIYGDNNLGKDVGSILGIPGALLSAGYLIMNQDYYYGVGAIILTNVLSYLYEHRKKSMRSKQEQPKSLKERMIKCSERGPLKRIEVHGGILWWE